MELVEEADSRQKMILWTINYFRILPTDERFKKLTSEQIELLFCSFVSSPTEEEYKHAYRRGMSKQEKIESMPKDILKDMGYSEEDIEKIGLEVAAGGLNA